MHCCSVTRFVFNPSRPHRNFITPKPLWELLALPKLAGFKGNGYSDKGSSQGTGKLGGRGTGEVKEGREGRKEGMEGGREGRKRGRMGREMGENLYTVISKSRPLALCVKPTSLIPLCLFSCAICMGNR